MSFLKSLPKELAFLWRLCADDQFNINALSYLCEMKSNFPESEQSLPLLACFFSVPFAPVLFSSFFIFIRSSMFILCRACACFFRS